jgi:hypothetical protein
MMISLCAAVDDLIVLLCPDNSALAVEDDDDGAGEKVLRLLCFACVSVCVVLVRRCVLSVPLRSVSSVCVL